MNIFNATWNAIALAYLTYLALRLTGFIRITERTEYGPMIENPDGTKRQDSEVFSKAELKWPWR